MAQSQHEPVRSLGPHGPQTQKHHRHESLTLYHHKSCYKIRSLKVYVSPNRSRLGGGNQNAWPNFSMSQFARPAWPCNPGSQPFGHSALKKTISVPKKTVSATQQRKKRFFSLVSAAFTSEKNRCCRFFWC